MPHVRRRAADGQTLTVFDLSLNGPEAEEAQRSTRDPDRVPVNVRVVVDGGSGDVTLTGPPVSQLHARTHDEKEL